MYHFVSRLEEAKLFQNVSDPISLGRLTALH